MINSSTISLTLRCLMCGIFCYCTSNELSGSKRGKLYESFSKIVSRGPEHSRFDRVSKDDTVHIGFQRLAINCVSPTGHQPFYHPTKDVVVMCNGEIYNYPEIAKEFSDKLVGTSDCEVLVWMYDKYGDDMFSMLDGVFAIIIYDGEKNKLVAARDPYGVRCMYLAYGKEGAIGFCSELKGLHDIFEQQNSTIHQFSPGQKLCLNLKDDSYYDTISLPFHDYEYSIDQGLQFMMDFGEVTSIVSKQIRDSFHDSIRKRLHLSDRPVACLLSGGLDSSLTCSVVSEYFDDPKMLHTFSIGMEGSTDLMYARMVAKHIGSTHHEIIKTEEEFCAPLDGGEIHRIIESWDTTTIRASLGNYLLIKEISETTEFKVLFNGDGSDELFGGYLYFQNAPTHEEFDTECKRRLRQIHHYDGERVDRSNGANGIDPRTPYLDLQFIQTVFSIPSRWRFAANKVMEKYFLRCAFDKERGGAPREYLPHEVLWRRKEAFSDGVSGTKRTTQQIIQEYIAKITKRDDSSSESLLNMEKRYHLEMFDLHYTGRASSVPGEWLPKWCGDVQDPSARELEHYNKK